MKRTYYSPEFEVTVINFENILEEANTSYPQTPVIIIEPGEEG